MAEDAVKAKSYIHRGIRFGQPASKVCDIKCEIHSRKPGKIPGQQPCAFNQPAQPCAGTATRIQNADRACPGSAQVSQLCLQKSPDAPIRICVHSVKGKQLRRIAVSIRDVIVTSLVVDSRDALGRSLMKLQGSMPNSG